jgi:hypothetical protein
MEMAPSFSLLDVGKLHSHRCSINYAEQSQTHHKHFTPLLNGYLQLIDRHKIFSHSRGQLKQFLNFLAFHTEKGQKFLPNMPEVESKAAAFE